MSSIALIGIAAGAYEANQSSQAAKDAQGKQEKALGSQLANSQQYQQQQAATYGPIEQGLTREAQSSEPLYYGQMAGAINQNVGAAERNLSTQMAARGMGGQGPQAGVLGGMEMGRAGTLAQAFQSGLQARTQLGQQLLGRYNPAQGVGMENQALSQISGMEGNQQTFYANAAQRGWGNVGQGIQALGTNLSTPAQSAVANPSIDQNTWGTGEMGTLANNPNGGANPGLELTPQTVPSYGQQQASPGLAPFAPIPTSDLVPGTVANSVKR
jgi:hypothetical protein